MNYIALYNDALQRGEITACRRVKAIYARLAAETAMPGRWAFDEERATRPITFIERFCKHSKGEWAGQPVRLALCQACHNAEHFGSGGAVAAGYRFNADGEIIPTDFEEVHSYDE